jgi:hypothetical protein
LKLALVKLFYVLARDFSLKHSTTSVGFANGFLINTVVGFPPMRFE